MRERTSASLGREPGGGTAEPPPLGVEGGGTPEGVDDADVGVGRPPETRLMLFFLSKFMSGQLSHASLKALTHSTLVRLIQGAAYSKRHVSTQLP